MKKVTIEMPRRESSGQSSTVATIIHAEGRRFDVWYRVSDGAVADGVESFTVASLVPAMHLGCALEVPAPISDRLLAGMNRIQQVLHGWYPHLKPIPILATSRAESLPQAKPSASFFSGGVDACYTLLQHHHEITRTIYVRGFDHLLVEQRIISTVSAALQHAARQLNRPLLEVETNIRDFGDLYSDWGHDYHGSVLASVALLLTPQFGTMYIPSSYPTADLFPWASHPELDPCWSTESLKIVHDGCDANRCQKVARVAQSDEALRVLRVCWCNFREGELYNCGKCEKCVRTMMDLRIAGALERCTTFARPFYLNRIKGLNLLSGHHRSFYEQSLRELQTHGHDPELERVLREGLSGRYCQGIGGWWRNIRKKTYRHALRPALQPVERAVKRLRKLVRGGHR